MFTCYTGNVSLTSQTLLLLCIFSFGLQSPSIDLNQSWTSKIPVMWKFKTIITLAEPHREHLNRLSCVWQKGNTRSSCLHRCYNSSGFLCTLSVNVSCFCFSLCKSLSVLNTSAYSLRLWLFTFLLKKKQPKKHMACLFHETACRCKLHLTIQLTKIHLFVMILC